MFTFLMCTFLMRSLNTSSLVLLKPWEYFRNSICYNVSMLTILYSPRCHLIIPILWVAWWNVCVSNSSLQKFKDLLKISANSKTYGLISSVLHYINPEVKLSPFINSYRKASIHTKDRFYWVYRKGSQPEPWKKHLKTPCQLSLFSGVLSSYLATGDSSVGPWRTQHLTSCLPMNWPLVLLSSLCRKSRTWRFHSLRPRYFSSKYCFSHKRNYDASC